MSDNFEKLGGCPEITEEQLEAQQAKLLAEGPLVGSPEWVNEYFRTQDPDRFLHEARRAVMLTFREDPLLGVTPQDLYITWFCKALKNWKAMVSTDVYKGLYWEVTFNGEKNEAYVDLYVKRRNTAVTL